EPYWHLAVTEDEDESALGCAVALLGEIADGYALHANNNWDPERLPLLPIPTRQAVEAIVVANGVDAWASALGHPLRLSSEVGELDQPPVVGPLQPIDFQAVAKTFHDTLLAYGHLLMLYRYEEGRETLMQWRERACRQVADCRNWFGWVRERLGLDGPY